MAYNTWSVVNFEQPDVTKWNQLGENDAFFNTSLDEGQVSFTGLSSSRTFTLPDANATLARTDAGQTFTGVNVFTSPKILTSIDDTNGNELLKLTATASAVNELTLANAATGGSPTLSATGGDTNIDLVLSAKGTGGVYVSNNFFIGNKTLSTATCQLKIGSGRTGDGFSLIDLVGDATYTDYGLRIIRLNGGANTASRILHKGTGDFDIWGEEASKIRFLTSGGVKMTVGAAITVDSAFNYAADAQASDTYVITLDPALTAYVAGQQVIFKANTANTGAASININGLGAKTIVKRVNTTLANSDILAGMFCHIVYDGTNFVLLNPVVN